LHRVKGFVGWQKQSVISGEPGGLVSPFFVQSIAQDL
jgi:hypothetical protein